MDNLTRRQAIGSAALSATGLTLAGTAGVATAQAATPPAAPAFAGKHAPKPLRFNPAKLTGLSERLITSHWENNYQGAVRGLNMIETRLAAAMTDPDFPPVVYAGLKREELQRTGSMVLHEYYFDALGGNGQPGGDIAAALGAGFGSFGAWEAEFRRTAMSLAGGSGWCILSYNRHTGSLHNYWASDHLHGPIDGAPLIALDMYEHAYHMDYGAAAARYVDVFMTNLDWEVVDARYRAARA